MFFDIVEVKEKSLVIKQYGCDLIKADQANTSEFDYDVLSTKNNYLMISYDVLIELNLKKSHLFVFLNILKGSKHN